MKLIICTLTLLLLSCGNHAETSSGSGSSQNSQLTGIIGEAYTLASQNYDFSTVYIEIGDAHGNWGEYYELNNTIVLSEEEASRHSVIENACALVHELEHHNGGSQEDAFAKQADCLASLRN